MKITIDRGIAYDFVYRHTDSAGVAVPLTGKKIYFTVKSAEFDTDATDAAATITKDITEHTNAAGGISGWTLTNQDTYKEPGKYHFDVIVEDIATSKAEPPSLKGDFVIKGHATNRNAQ